MNTFSTVLMLLVATCSAGKSSSFEFRARDFIEDYIPFMGKYQQEGKCGATFQPYAVDFDFKNTPNLLLVASGWLTKVPTITLGQPIWYMKDTYIFLYVNASVSDFTVFYNVSIGTVRHDTYDLTQCLVTAKNTGYFFATTKELRKDFTGSNILYLYPAKNWALIVHSVDIKTDGTWDISASCPGADSRLVNKLVDTVKKVELVKRRDIVLDNTRSCADAVLPKLEIADYITSYSRH